MEKNSKTEIKIKFNILSQNVNDFKQELYKR